MMTVWMFWMIGGVALLLTAAVSEVALRSADRR